MARVTIEDCLMYVDNRFKLVLAASKRARKLSVYGAEPLIAWNNDKSTVVALREIASGYSFKDNSVNEIKQIKQGHYKTNRILFFKML